MIPSRILIPLQAARYAYTIDTQSFSLEIAHPAIFPRRIGKDAAVDRGSSAYRHSAVAMKLMNEIVDPPFSGRNAARAALGGPVAPFTVEVSNT